MNPNNYPGASKSLYPSLGFNDELLLVNPPAVLYPSLSGTDNESLPVLPPSLPVTHIERPSVLPPYLPRTYNELLSAVSPSLPVVCNEPLPVLPPSLPVAYNEPPRVLPPYIPGTYNDSLPVLLSSLPIVNNEPLSVFPPLLPDAYNEPPPVLPPYLPGTYNDSRSVLLPSLPPACNEPLPVVPFSFLAVCDEPLPVVPSSLPLACNEPLPVVPSSLSVVCNEPLPVVPPSFSETNKKLPLNEPANVPSSLPPKPPTPKPTPAKPTTHLFCVGGKIPSEKCMISKYVLDGDPEWASVHRLGVELISCPAASIGSKIYIAKSSNSKKFFYEYDCPALELRSLPDLPYKREGLAMTSLGNSLFISGGRRRYYDLQQEDPLQRIKFESQNDAHRFNITRNRWEKIADMNNERHFHVMVAGNGLVYAIGGHDGMSSVEEYHPSQDIWLNTRVRIQTDRESLSAAFHDGAIYVCGSKCFDRVTPNELPFQASLPPPPNPKANSMVSFNGKLLSIGGRMKGSGDQTARVYEFETRTGSWIRQPDMDVQRKRHSSVVVTY